MTTNAPKPVVSFEFLNDEDEGFFALAENARRPHHKSDYVKRRASNVSSEFDTPDFLAENSTEEKKKSGTQQEVEEGFD